MKKIIILTILFAASLFGDSWPIRQRWVQATRAGELYTTGVQFAPWGYSMIGTFGRPADELHSRNVNAYYSIGFDDLDADLYERMSSVFYDTLNIKNSDRIDFYGDSYLEGNYSYLNDSSVPQFSRRSPFHVENFAVSGATITNCLDYYQTPTDVRSYPYLPRPARYVVIQTLINDRTSLTQDQYRFGLEKFIREVLSKGSEPIITTPGFYPALNKYDYPYILIQKEVAEKFNLRFVNNLSGDGRLAAYTTGTSKYPKGRGEDGGNTHPNSMGSLYYSLSMEEALRDLVPVKSLKIWRPDSVKLYDLGIDAARDTLLFADVDSKLAVWKEINLSQKHGLIHEAGTASTKISEYARIANGTAISFRKFAMIEATFPFTAAGCRHLEVSISGLSSDDYKLYALSSNDTTNTYTLWTTPQKTFVEWDSVNSWTGTSISHDFGGVTNRYLHGNTMYLLVQRTDTATFTMSASPEFLYSGEAETFPRTVKRVVSRGDELVTYQYFNKAGRLTWDGDTLFADGTLTTWDFPASDSTFAVYTPYEADDTLMVVAAGDTCFKTISLSGYEDGDEFELEIWAQNADPGYNVTTNMQVDLHFGTSYPPENPDSMVTTYNLKCQPIWYANKIYFRKPYPITNIYVAIICPAGGVTYYVSKVGLRKVLRH